MVDHFWYTAKPKFPNHNFILLLPKNKAFVILRLLLLMPKIHMRTMVKSLRLMLLVLMMTLMTLLMALMPLLMPLMLLMMSLVHLMMRLMSLHRWLHLHHGWLHLLGKVVHVGLLLVLGWLLLLLLVILALVFFGFLVLWALFFYLQPPIWMFISYSCHLLKRFFFRQIHRNKPITKLLKMSLRIPFFNTTK